MSIVDKKYFFEAIFLDYITIKSTYIYLGSALAIKNQRLSADCAF